MNSVIQYTILTITLLLPFITAGCDDGMDCRFENPQVLDKARFYGDTLTRILTNSELSRLYQNNYTPRIDILVKDPVYLNDSLYKLGVKVIEDSSLKNTIISSLVIRSIEPGITTFPIRDSVMNGRYIVWISSKYFTPNSVQQKSTKGATLQCTPPYIYTHFLESAVVYVPRGMRFNANYRYN